MTSLLASPSALAPEQRIRLRQLLIQNHFNARDFAGAEHLTRDALAEKPDDADFAWALITAQANQGHMDQAGASYHHLRPVLSGPELATLWLDLLSRRTVADADVEAAVDAAEQWLGSLAARHLIEGTMAMIAALPQSEGQPHLAEGISAQNLTRLAALLCQPGSQAVAVRCCTPPTVKGRIRSQMIARRNQLARTLLIEQSVDRFVDRGAENCQRHVCYESADRWHRCCSSGVRGS